MQPPLTPRGIQWERAWIVMAWGEGKAKGRGGGNGVQVEGINDYGIG